MKSLLRAILLLLIASWIIFKVLGKSTSNQYTTIQFIAPSLSGNLLGEDSSRIAYVYLPPGYDTSTKRYPCLYYLHGFTSDHEEYNHLKFAQLMDAAIANGVIEPCILVVPNSSTKYEGSFYTNSEIGGKWADYIAKDLVHVVDRRFRTLAESKFRCLFGHSMGGNGALKIALQNQDVFGSVYALSPSVINWSGEFNLQNPSFRIIQSAKSREDIQNDFYSRVLVAMGRVYSAEAEVQPFQCKMPVRYDSFWRIDSATLALWNREMVTLQYKEALSRGPLKIAIGFDCGLEDEFKHIPISCAELDSVLNFYGQAHDYSTYHGNHYEKVGGFEGRIYKNVLPFFSKHLRTK